MSYELALTSIITFLSVFFGFYLNSRREGRNDDQSRKEAIGLIISELRDCATTCGHNLMPIDTWEAIKSSGKAMLLEHNVLLKKDVGLLGLARIYYKIRMYNYEAEKLRMAEIQLNLLPTGISNRAVWVRQFEADNLQMWTQTVNDVNRIIRLLEEAEQDYNRYQQSRLPERIQGFFSWQEKY